MYLPDNTECAGRYDEAPDTSGDFRFTMGDGYDYSIDMDGGVVRDGETLVISASQIPNGATVSVGVATGDVGPYVPVPHTKPSESRAIWCPSA